MDYWAVNVFVGERCADIRADIASYRQMRAAQSNFGWFEQRMLSLGLWLVDVGEGLQKRYEVSETNTSFNGI